MIGVVPALKESVIDVAVMCAVCRVSVVVVCDGGSTKGRRTKERASEAEAIYNPPNGVSGVWRPANRRLGGDYGLIPSRLAHSFLCISSIYSGSLCAMYDGPVRGGERDTAHRREARRAISADARV